MLSEANKNARAVVEKVLCATGDQVKEGVELLRLAADRQTAGPR